MLHPENWTRPAGVSLVQDFAAKPRQQARVSRCHVDDSEDVAGSPGGRELATRSGLGRHAIWSEGPDNPVADRWRAVGNHRSESVLAGIGHMFRYGIVALADREALPQRPCWPAIPAVPYPVPRPGPGESAGNPLQSEGGIETSRRLPVRGGGESRA
jgi:hypothetical protein